MTFSLSDVSNLVQKAEKKIAPLDRSFVGVDIGASSTKIVQLAVIDDVVTLETYGEIGTVSPACTESAQGSLVSQVARSAELSDLLHEVNAQSRNCGVAVSLAEAFINTIDLPKRDPEQMRRIIPSEAQKLIPIPVQKVMLDWYTLPEAEASAFDTLKPHQQTESHFQKVIVVAVNNETAHRLGGIVSESRLSPSFYEIEMFSAARACARAATDSTFILDLGASSTKAYTVNEDWIVCDARLIPVGGTAITGEVMKALSCDLLAAERAKCERGFSAGSEASTAIASALAPIWTYAQQMFDDHTKRGGKPIKHVLLAGGGSYMPDIVDLVSNKLSLPVEVIRSFERTKGPMILEDTLREDGPRFAVAVGLALRGIGR